MQIKLNGEPRDIPNHCTAEELVALLDLTGKRLAMEVNRDIVPRSAYAAHRLHEGDEVEIVHAIGGGGGVYFKGSDSNGTYLTVTT
jgi:sulfur carrier protein